MALREHLLPDIHQQLNNLRADLMVVHDKLDSLVIRAPISGKLTALDLKVGEMRSPGQRLAEVAPDTGMKLVADIDEFYLPRVNRGQTATVDLGGKSVMVTVRRVLPQVKDGQFRVDLSFDTTGPAALVEGATARGHLQLGEDRPANILVTGPFLERTGGDWVFVVAADGRSAQRRRIKVGRRTSDQIEVLSGLIAGDRVIISDYTGLDRVERVRPRKLEAAPMLKLEHISKSYRTSEVETAALDDVSLEVQRGEFLAIMGPSGCGKSTLLNILGLIDSPTSGSYWFMGEDVARCSEADLTLRRRAGVGFVFQNFNLIDNLSVAENIEVGLLYRRVRGSDAAVGLPRSGHGRPRSSHETSAEPTFRRSTAARCGGPGPGCRAEDHPCR